MNPGIHLALIFWAAVLSGGLFAAAIQSLKEDDHTAAILCSVVSFLSFFTALLAIGEYIH